VTKRLVQPGQTILLTNGTIVVIDRVARQKVYGRIYNTANRVSFPRMNMVLSTEGEHKWLEGDPDHDQTVDWSEE